MKGCRIIVWAIMITPIALLALLFAISPRAGFVGLGLIVTAASLYLGAGFLAVRRRRLCPACNLKQLKCIAWFRANPPPNWYFYRCEGCGSEFVEVDGKPGLVERERSRFKDSPGWETT